MVLIKNPYISTKIGLNWKISLFDLNIMIQALNYFSYDLTYGSCTFWLISHFCLRGQQFHAWITNAITRHLVNCRIIHYNTLVLALNFTECKSRRRYAAFDPMRMCACIVTTVRQQRVLVLRAQILYYMLLRVLGSLN